MSKYRIHYVDHNGDPCHWQPQKRVLLLFWRNIGGRVSSVKTASTVIENLIIIERSIKEKSHE